jgi:hypothetical protein
VRTGQRAVSGGRSRRSPNFINKIIVIILVIGLVGTFVALQYFESYGNGGGLAIDWRMKLTFVDARYSPVRNYTLPAGIGLLNGYWLNHTFDRFGPSGYSPLSTRDSSSTIWIQSTQVAYFSFGDFFNIWGKTFDQLCVPDLSNSGTYCARAADPVIYDTNSNGRFDPGIDTIVQVTSQLTVRLPQSNSTLSFDPRIRFVNASNVAMWNSTQAVVYDPDQDGIYHSATDLILYLPSNGAVAEGTPTKMDPRLRYYDWNAHQQWDGPIPPAVMSDGTKERCVDRVPLLSNKKDWLIITWSTIAASTIQGRCVPAGF